MLTTKHLKELISKKKDTLKVSKKNKEKIKVGPTGHAYNVAFLEDLKNAKVKDSVITKSPFRNKSIKNILSRK